LRRPLEAVHRSNLLTYASLAAGVTAMAVSRDAGGRSLAGALLATAALADTFDGRFARRFDRSPWQRRIGAEIDNVVDAVVFGAVPVSVLASLAPPGAGWQGRLWWGAAFAYVLSAVTRLAFFAAESDDDHFVGMPTPVAGLVWSTVLLWPADAWVMSAVFACCAGLMVAPLRYARPRGLGLAPVALWAAGLMCWHLLRAGAGRS
jgi:phosphatidylserine synthase